MRRDPSRAGERAASIRERWNSGDREGAYAQVVEETKDSLFRYLRHMLRDEEAAQDAFQDTYMKVFRALGTYRGEASLTTWVLTIGRNTALNRIRRARGKEDRTVSLDVEPSGPEPAVGPDEPVVTRSLVAALDALPEAQREAVLLFYAEDRPLAEVARITGRPANTIKSDLLRARKRLRRALEDEV